MSVVDANMITDWKLRAPLHQVGLASIAVAVQRSGGSAQHPAEVMNESLEQMAAGIEGGALPEAIVVGEILADHFVNIPSFGKACETDRLSSVQASNA